jgi:hypothetical protein
MSFEFLVKELPDQMPAPSFWVIEACIKREVSFIKLFCLHLMGFRSVDWHIEYGKIQETNAIMMLHNKLKGPSRL